MFHAFYQAHKESKNRAEAQEIANSGGPKTNEQIAEELFKDFYFHKTQVDQCVTLAGKEKEIIKELQRRKFDFTKSNVEINFTGKKWTHITVKNYEK